MKKKAYLIASLILLGLGWGVSCLYMWQHRCDCDDIDFRGDCTTNNVGVSYQMGTKSFGSTSAMRDGSYGQSIYQMEGIALPETKAFSSTGLYMSSSQEMKSIGGGMAQGGVVAMSGNSNSNASQTSNGAVGIVSMPIINHKTTFAQASSNISGGQTTDETAEAMGIMRRSVMATMADGEPDYDPEDPWKTPVGATPWLAMLAMACAYIIKVRMSARKEK